ncbi:hypothetical protein AA0119_g12191 [Alternaria tenuissima]|uniref:Tyrosine specific protein phosphatases domain-containing protein n=1 Tax=Alternaria tenuissima TaxID=119927 RepID=A0ABY0FRY3_9PLEO|nr:hypothetical protein AA0119_g12191 [Alternaria tenuissima]
MATPDNTTLPSPPFYTHIPNINNLRLATHALTTKSGATLRPNLLFRSAEVSKVDVAGWTALRQLGVGHVFDLRSKPEVDKGHSNNDNNNNNNNNNNSTDDANADAVVGSKAGGGGGGGGGGGMQEAGVQRTGGPVFEESDYSPGRLAERYAKYMDQDVRGFVEAYSEFLKSGGNAYGIILRYLANLSVAPGQEEGEGVRPQGALIHCTAGKDRTGMFFGLLFDFLGVPRDQIADEYHLTQLGLAGVREQVVARLLASPAFTKYMTAQVSGTPISPGDIAKALHDDAARGSSAGSDGDKQIPQEILDKGREAALRMVSARKESMLGALEMLDRQFSGAERYMREVCGLGDGELEGLRRNLLVGYGHGA